MSTLHNVGYTLYPCTPNRPPHASTQHVSPDGNPKSRLERKGEAGPPETKITADQIVRGHTFKAGAESYRQIM